MEISYQNGVWYDHILLDHLVDRIERSNQRLECLSLLPPHLYKAMYPIQHYKIGRMLLFVWFAFACPVCELSIKEKTNDNDQQLKKKAAR